MKYLIFKPTIDMVDPRFGVRVEFNTKNVLKKYVKNIKFCIRKGYI